MLAGFFAKAIPNDEDGNAIHIIFIHRKNL